VNLNAGLIWLEKLQKTGEINVEKLIREVSEKIVG